MHQPLRPITVFFHMRQNAGNCRRRRSSQPAAECLPVTVAGCPAPNVDDGDRVLAHDLGCRNLHLIDRFPRANILAIGRRYWAPR
jgi:hypothetical protein